MYPRQKRPIRTCGFRCHLPSTFTFKSEISRSQQNLPPNSDCPKAHTHPVRTNKTSHSAAEAMGNPHTASPFAPVPTGAARQMGEAPGREQGQLCLEVTASSSQNCSLPLPLLKVLARTTCHCRYSGFSKC